MYIAAAYSNIDRRVTLPPVKALFAVTSIPTLLAFLRAAPEVFRHLIFVFAMAFILDTFFGLIVAATHRQWKSRRQRVMSADKMLGYMIAMSFGLLFTILGNAWWISEGIVITMVLCEMKSLLESFDNLAEVYDFGKLGETIHAVARLLDTPESSTHKRIEMSAVFDSQEDSPTVSAVAIEQTMTKDAGRKGGSNRERSVPVHSGPS